MNDELFKLILSMDAYNRGYNAALDLSTVDEMGDTVKSDRLGNMLGNATIYLNKGDAAAQFDDFYAIAYQLPDDSVVILYRGTDSPFGSSSRAMFVTDGIVAS